MPIAKFVVLFIAIGLLVIQLGWALMEWPMLDADAYWQAGLRLRDGGPLYPAWTDPSTGPIYRYSPWFAQLWIPLTHLPQSVVYVGWGIAVTAATLLSVLPLLSRRSAASIAAAALIGSYLLLTARHGNVQPLMIAALVWGVERRSGPLWIAVAASLKFFPLIYVLVYAGRGEWRRVAATLGLAAILIAPMLLFDLTDYTTTPAAAPLSLFLVSPVVWGAVAAGALGVALVSAFTRSRYAWLAAGVAVLLCPPQGHLSYLSYLLVGSPASPRGRGQRNEQEAELVRQ